MSVPGWLISDAASQPQQGSTGPNTNINPNPNKPVVEWMEY